MKTTPSLTMANSARALANETRARELIDVAEGRRDIHSVIRRSTAPDGKPLLRITLRQLLIAQPGWGPQRAAVAIEKTLSVVGTPHLSPRKISLAWLLDPRAGGKRFMAFCDSLAPSNTAPWAGFPFTPKPSAVSK